MTTDALILELVDIAIRNSSEIPARGEAAWQDVQEGRAEIARLIADSRAEVQTLEKKLREANCSNALLRARVSELIWSRNPLIRPGV